MQNDLKRLSISHSNSPRFRLLNSSHLVGTRSELVSGGLRNELPNIPPKREIDFGIELLQDTNQISIPLYRMSPAEMMKLKAQLKDLLDKGFIRLSILPWGCPLLL